MRGNAKFIWVRTWEQDVEMRKGQRFGIGWMHFPISFLHVHFKIIADGFLNTVWTLSVWQLVLMEH